MWANIDACQLLATAWQVGVWHTTYSASMPEALTTVRLGDVSWCRANSLPAGSLNFALSQLCCNCVACIPTRFLPVCL